MTLRAALYLRISKDDAGTGLAVDRQRSECLKVIEREKLELFDTYADNGVSAYARNVRRPEFDRMTRDYEAGKFDVVVCWDLDRFSRQPLQLEQWIEMGQARGLKFMTPSETLDLGTDNGRLFARIKADIATGEVERKSTRQRLATAQAKANGTFKGRIGFNDGPTISRIFALAAAGDGAYKIAQALNADGLRTLAGHPWSGQAVKGVIRSERHRGALVDVETWDAAQALMGRGTRVGAKAKGRFSGVARCVCGAAETASGERYVCSYATNHPGERGHVTVLRSVLDKEIDAAMIAAFAFGRESIQPQTADVTALDVEIAKVMKGRKELLDLVAAQVTTLDEVAPQLRDLKSKMTTLEDHRSAVIAENAHAAMIDGIVSFLTPGKVEFEDLTKAKATIKKRWDGLENDKRRDLAKEFLSVKITADRNARIEIRHLVADALNDEFEDVG